MQPSFVIYRGDARWSNCSAWEEARESHSIVRAVCGSFTPKRGVLCRGKFEVQCGSHNSRRFLSLIEYRDFFLTYYLSLSLALNHSWTQIAKRNPTFRYVNVFISWHLQSLTSFWFCFVSHLFIHFHCPHWFLGFWVLQFCSVRSMSNFMFATIRMIVNVLYQRYYRTYILCTYGWALTCRMKSNYFRCSQTS